MTAKFQYDLSELTPMLAFATARERAAVEAIQATGSGPAAAELIGVSLSQIHCRIKCLKERHRARLLAAAAPPAGFTPVQISTDEQGRVRSVRSRPESTDVHLDVQPDGHSIRGVSTLLDASGEVRGQWIKTDRTKDDLLRLFTEATELHVRRYSGLAAPVDPPVMCNDDLETWYPLGDPHLGLLAHRSEVGLDADLKIASRILYETVDMLIQRSPASHVGVVCSLGDYFHSDSNLNRTVSGHQLDVDSRHAKVAEVGFSLMRRMIERALTKHAQVVVINAPGNHAPNTEKMMGLWLRAVFEREPRVQVLDSTNPYIYRRFGCNLIGVHHGDGAKPQALPEIMACDRPEDWGITTHRAWYTGHIHHDSRRDYRGCTVESFRTMNSADAWSHHSGYRSGRSLQAITLHRRFGEQGRVTVGIQEVDSALGGEGA
jgi:hypothetical protein